MGDLETGRVANVDEMAGIFLRSIEPFKAMRDAACNAMLCVYDLQREVFVGGCCCRVALSIWCQGYLDKYCKF